MNLNEKLEKEKVRNSVDDFSKIFLYKEGKFYHAFEVSAFLIKKYVCTEEFQRGRGDKDIIKSERYNGKNGEYVLVGFPVESLSKFVPAYKSMDSLDGNNLVITIDINMFGEDATGGALNKAFNDWKASCPLHEQAANRNRITQGASPQTMLARSGLFSIVSEVLGYPLESGTAEQNIEFIRSMKRKVVSLL